MATKREYDVSNIEINDDATVPWPQAKNRPNLLYFNGKITDVKKVARFVSFEPKLRADIEQLRQQKKPLALTHCNNKIDSTSLEILANKYSSVLLRSLKLMKVCHPQRKTLQTRLFIMLCA